MSTPRAVPLDLTFEVTHQFRPIDLIAPRFVQFDTAHLRLPERETRVPIPHHLVAPFGAVVVSVTELAEGGTIHTGWQSSENGDSVRVRYDPLAGAVTIEVVTGDTVDVVARAPVELRAPFRFAATLTGNMVTALADAGGEWVPLVAEAKRVAERVDLRRPEVLRRYAHTVGGRRAVLDRVQAGYFGQVGLRDPHLVQTADGRPYRRDGRYLLTFGCAGMGFSQEAHWAVWAMDPAAPDQMEQVAKLFFAHDGVVIGDNAGQIVYDEERGRFIILVCGGNLPTPGVYVRHATTTDDILTGVHVIPNERLPAPARLSAWEPALARIDRRWHIAYADVVQLDPDLAFHPVLVTAPEGADYTERLTVRASDPSVRRTEGCILQRFGDDWYLLATDDADRQYRVYDLDLRQVGALDAPFLAGGPHPQVFPVTADQREWMMVTFANVQYHEKLLGYGTEGDVVIMRGRMNR